MNKPDLASLSGHASWRDYYEMCKPRVVALMLLCAAAGALLATPGLPPLNTFLLAMAGIALVAGSAAAVNHLADAHVDVHMARTRARPLPAGRVSPTQGAVFAAVLGILGHGLLFIFVNPLTAWLNFASWFGYGIVYTLWLKWATPQNIVIGGLFGAAPPLFGWTAITGSIEPGALLLVLIIFTWTPPHFWALAIDRKKEYAKVGTPMLPVTHGDDYTSLHILFYTLMLLAISLLPFVIGMSGLFYLGVAMALGVGFIVHAVLLLSGRDARAPMRTFRYSIFYLAVLFIVLLMDHYLLPVYRHYGLLVSA